MMAFVKKDLVDIIRKQLGEQLERLRRAARESQRAATDPGSKAESKYDTRNLEASYLAVGQAKQVEDLERAARLFERFSLPDYEGMGAAGPGALVEIKSNEGCSWYLLVPAAGGLEIEDSGRIITLLSPDSPLYQRLLGCEVGQMLDRPVGRVRSIL